MKRLGTLRERLRALVRRDAVIEEIDEEMRFHVELETQTNIERGMRPKDARAAALRSFGNPGRMKDLAYEIRGGRVMDKFWQDLRYGLRRLLKNPAFTCAALALHGPDDPDLGLDLRLRACVAGDQGQPGR